MTKSPRKPKEPLLALLLSVWIMGLGQIYTGLVLRGLVIMVVPALLAIILLIYIFQPDTTINQFGMIAIAISFLSFVIWVYIDSYISAKRFNLRNHLERNITKSKRILLICGIIIAYLLPGPSLLMALYIRANFIQAFKIPSGAMRMALREGDRLMADKRQPLLSRLKRGDVIVFDYPKDPQRKFVKRLIAFGGESVEIIKGDVYINGRLVTEAEIKNNYYYNQGAFGESGRPVEVPPGYLYVLGDNSGASHDSRMWGFVPEDNVIGIAYKIYWPPERSGPLH